jgi:serine phosphatase RsbU (regulator of sigma subunit)
LALRFGDWRRTQTTSAANLLRKGLPDDLFKGQIVLVGLTSAGSSDVVTTPLASETYGVFVQAQAVDAILRGEGLRTPIWATAVVWNLGVLLTLAAVGLVWRLPAWGMAAGAVGAVLATAVMSWAAFRSGLLLDPFPTAVPMVVTVAAMLAGLFAEGRRLQARLRLALQEERVAAAKVAGELAAAADIQAGMLLPRADLERLRKDVELDAVLQPARNVGGDLYDAFTLPDGRLCFLVGDVTGKGVPAALFMALSKSLARNLLTRPGLDLTAAVAEINAELSTDNREAMALSLLVGVLEDADGRLSLCCAGHENPLIAGADGTVRDVTLIGGPPLCVAASFPYTVEPCRLGPGETLLVFSDGLTEAQAPDGTLLSRDQLFALVGKASRAPTAAAMVDAVVAGVRAFEAGSEPSDDLTVLALRLPSG